MRSHLALLKTYWFDFCRGRRVACGPEATDTVATTEIVTPPGFSTQPSYLRQLCAIGALLMLITFSPALCAQIASSTAAPSPTANAGNPFRQLTLPSRKPMPVRWKIAIVLAVVVIASGALWISIRVWGSANLFDRQYRFSAPESAALRLGANRSGGHSATIRFGDRAGPEDAG